MSDASEWAMRLWEGNKTAPEVWDAIADEGARRALERMRAEADPRTLFAEVAALRDQLSPPPGADPDSADNERPEGLDAQLEAPAAPEECSWAEVDGVRYKTEIIDGIQRFPENPIIRDLLSAASDRANPGLDLNEIARRGYRDQDRQELYRLIGYSVCGFADAFPDAKVDSSCWKKE